MDPGFDLGHDEDAQGELGFDGQPAQSVLVEVVGRLDRQFAEPPIARFSGLLSGGVVATPRSSSSRRQGAVLGRLVAEIRRPARLGLASIQMIEP
ncbi:hypothetical protein TA3x_005749 (plasmid) [Tundrisphaera sp. TA3]|uniref:hypothetical protein n=1 Tax=Tundrisphaera sp. TA3 TaxID=3435775 RepID=UPI003EB6CBB4